MTTDTLHHATAGRVTVRVMCAQCNRPVDRVLWEYDLPTERYVLHAQCHGATDTQSVSTTQLEAQVGTPLAVATFTNGATRVQGG